MCCANNRVITGDTAVAMLALLRQRRVQMPKCVLLARAGPGVFLLDLRQYFDFFKFNC